MDGVGALEWHEDHRARRRVGGVHPLHDHAEERDRQRREDRHLLDVGRAERRHDTVAQACGHAQIEGLLVEQCALLPQHEAHRRADRGSQGRDDALLIHVVEHLVEEELLLRARRRVVRHGCRGRAHNVTEDRGADQHDHRRVDPCGVVLLVDRLVRHARFVILVGALLAGDDVAVAHRGHGRDRPVDAREVLPAEVLDGVLVLQVIVLHVGDGVPEAAEDVGDHE
mmetsp:Transcript_7346/g.15318  ORF Transcript_7346/g.15318 Transcript_7346/m.15318 type:complete len:226 (+) Transcript_7346:1877-2554(+)